MNRGQLAWGYRRSGSWRPETLVQRFDRTCLSAPHGVAIVDGDRRLTFVEVDQLVGRLARHLVELGVQPRDVVSWQLPNWWEAVVVHFAALRVGAVPNPVNPIYRAAELRAVLGEARPKVLVVPKTFRGFGYAGLASKIRHDVPTLEHVIVARGAAPGAVELDALIEADAPSPPWIRPEDPSATALLLYTSGTTGTAKGVQHTHETLLYEIDSLRDVHAITPSDRYLGGGPVAHIAGLVYGVLMPFALGTSTVLLDRWNAGRAIDLIERERVTFQMGTPTFLQTLGEDANADRRDLSSFRLFSTSWASITAELIRDAGKRLGCVVKRAYGSTEVPTLTATSVDDPEDARLETDGRAIGPAEMRIVTDRGRDVRPGNEGEIWARSPEVFVGYRDPTLEEEAFAQDGWYRTGDIGRVDADGYLRVTGRLKDIIIRGGENVSVKEIEDLLSEHPGIAEVAVVGMPDRKLGDRTCAVVVPRSGQTPTLEGVVDFLRDREIASQKLPERLELRERLPKTASGKVVKAVLRNELRQVRSS
jgi:non-ribosomal peptide synthetase component E (peptide arylation enzyme)